MSQTPRQPQTPLQRTLITLALIIGSALPVMIAFVLIMSTNDGDNPLDRIPDYSDPLAETLTVPFDRAEPLETEYRYYGQVRIVVEGSGMLAGVGTLDALYVFAGEDGTPLGPPQLTASGLAIDGAPALDALGLAAEPPDYADDHLYSAIYDLGGDYRRVRFGVAGGGSSGAGALTVTIVQLG
ncbi:MAG: hypothetical protein M5U29_04920 [Anaerolineae bacterium]|nr:hypothetical protein [Anaerolineae bacterium]